MRWMLFLILLAPAVTLVARASNPPVPWPATDGLGRSLPTSGDTGPPRADRTVAMFYFLWLGPHARQGGPWDVSKILAEDPSVMGDPDSPRWGPMHAPHHWGESVFGYYNSDDPYVLRKHAQMLTDAGVDVVVFDVTNQLTYQSQYEALMKMWSAVRREGGRTPQVAFLCPFWQPAKVVRTLWRDLYAPGIHRDLWFEWQGKPLILADPERLTTETAEFQFNEHPVALAAGHTLGQTFIATRRWTAVAARVPTWATHESAVTLTVRRDGPQGAVVASRRAERVVDNDWMRIECPTEQAPGRYLLELSDARGRIGWWSHPSTSVLEGAAMAGGQDVPGGRSLRVEFVDPLVSEIRAFFTFRAPQPDYFAGPQGRSDMWSWLEVFPQHVFLNARGENEQMSVGVAQNAVGSRLGSMSESAGARGRIFHRGARDPRADMVAHGLNFAEQFEHALRADPHMLFITGWNEWIAGRHDEFNGIREPVMFVDQFNQEFSRDIEPMKGGHGDAYYYQLAHFIRKFKGTPPLPPASSPQSIDLAGSFAQWDTVTPAFPDDAGDTTHRLHPGYAEHAQYTNTTGRNDIVLAKTTAQGDSRAFYVECRAPLTASTGPGWMWLLIDADGNPATGWEGYDIIVNRTPPTNGLASVERHLQGWQWESIGSAPIRWHENQLHLQLPLSLIPANLRVGSTPIDFKWVDHMPENGDIVSWLDAGDAAPNGRFNYRVEGGW